MSRIGKIPVALPRDVQVTVDKGVVNLKGPRGRLSLSVPEHIVVETKDQQILVSRKVDTKQTRANQGTTRAHLANMVSGVTKGHRKDLEIRGVGFRAQLKGQEIEFNLGLSHPVTFKVLDIVKVTIAKPTEISVEGNDKGQVGLVAAQIRGLKPPEPYKGKGIRYVGEFVRQKQGKAVTK